MAIPAGIDTIEKGYDIASLNRCPTLTLIWMMNFIVLNSNQSCYQPFLPPINNSNFLIIRLQSNLRLLTFIVWLCKPHLVWIDPVAPFLWPMKYINTNHGLTLIDRDLDFMNLLSYDYHSSYEAEVNHHAPLRSFEDSEEYDFDAELNVVSPNECVNLTNHYID